METLFHLKKKKKTVRLPIAANSVSSFNNHIFSKKNQNSLKYNTLYYLFDKTVKGKADLVTTFEYRYL